MDFFDRQSKARSKSKIILFVFFTFLILPAFAFQMIFLGFYIYYGTNGNIVSILFYTVAFTFPFYMLYWTLKKMKDPEFIAGLVDAVRVPAKSKMDEFHRYRNVAEEMSIASGAPMPLLYTISDSESINAFVAGMSPEKSVLCVTTGALKQLNRDELQAVIAHEFSHLLNGDSRMNTTLSGLIMALKGSNIFTITGFVKQHFFKSKTSRQATEEKEQEDSAVVTLVKLFLNVMFGGMFSGRTLKMFFGNRKTRRDKDK